MDQILHPCVKAVMVRFVPVQPDVRHVMCAKSGRHSRSHLRPDHVDIVCVEFHIAGFDIDDAPVLPAVPLVDPLVLPNPHGPVEEQRPADEVHPVEFDRADQVEIKDVRVGQRLLLQFRQRVLEGASPELVIAQCGDHWQVSRDERPQRCGKQAHLRRGNGVSRHDYGIR